MRPLPGGVTLRLREVSIIRTMPAQSDLMEDVTPRED